MEVPSVRGLVGVTRVIMPAAGAHHHAAHLASAMRAAHARTSRPGGRCAVPRCATMRVGDVLPPISVRR